MNKHSLSERQHTLKKLILLQAKARPGSRSPADIDALLDALPDATWPDGCPQKLQAFIADVLDPAVWRNEWGKWGSPDYRLPKFTALTS